MSEMKPEIRFEGFEEGWNKFNFMDIVNKIVDFRGRTPKKLGKSWTEGNYMALSALNVKNGYIDYTADPHFGDRSLYKKWMDGNELQRGQVLLTTEAPVGNVAQVPKDNSFILSQRTISFIVNENIITNDFLFSLLSSDIIHNQLLKLSSGGTAKGVSQKSLKKLEVLIPAPLEEQQKISKTVKIINKKLILKQKELDKLIHFKQAMLQKMFPKEGETVPEIRFEGFEEEWNNYSLNDVAEIVGGGTPSTNIAEYWGGDINWYSPNEIINSRYVYNSKKKITEVGLNKSSAKILPANKTILFTSRATIGEMAILKEEAATNQGFQSLIIREQFDVNFVYIIGFKIKEYALNMSSGSTFLEISGKTLGKVNIRIPNLEEQKLIGHYFYELDKQITNKQKELDKLSHFKQAMLDKMFV